MRGGRRSSSSGVTTLRWGRRSSRPPAGWTWARGSSSSTQPTHLRSSRSSRRRGSPGRVRSGTSSPSCRRTGRDDMVGYFLGFEQGWWAVTNREHRVGFGLAWDANVFPFTCFWHELRASEGFPWFGRGYALALEPVTSWPAAGIAEVARTTGTQRLPGTGQTVETEVWAADLRGGLGSRADRAGRQAIARTMRQTPQSD